VDPDNPHRDVGMCRVALRRRDFSAATSAALAGLQRLYEYPLGHFCWAYRSLDQGLRARGGCVPRRADANPNFPQAHLRLAMLLKRRLNDPEAAEEHMRLYRELRRNARGGPAPGPPRDEPDPAGPVEAQPVQQPAVAYRLPPLGAEMAIDPGCRGPAPRWSCRCLRPAACRFLRMDLRPADEDNPRGYFEYEPVKRMPPR